MPLFDSWSSLGSTAAAAIVGYGALIAFLRTSGKRTLAALNAFDLVVTVALGSTLASVLTSPTLPLLNGLLALGMLVALQFAVTWTSVRIRWVRQVVRAEPTLLVHRGVLLDEAMRRSRMGPSEILSALRSADIAQVTDVAAVVLEPDGSLSVLSGAAGGDQSTLRDVRGGEASAG